MLQCMVREKGLQWEVMSEQNKQRWADNGADCMGLQTWGREATRVGNLRDFGGHSSQVKGSFYYLGEIGLDFDVVR